MAGGGLRDPWCCVDVAGVHSALGEKLARGRRSPRCCKAVAERGAPLAARAGKTVGANTIDPEDSMNLCTSFAFAAIAVPPRRATPLSAQPLAPTSR